MPSESLPYVQTWEGQFPTLLARIEPPDGTQLMRADCKTCELNVFDLNSPTPRLRYYTSPIRINDVLFDSYQLDGWWRRDSKGYNFRHTLTDSFIPLVGGKRYRLEYLVILLTNEVLPVVGTVGRLSLYSKR